MVWITGASLSVMLAGVKEFEGPVAGVRIVSDEAGNFIFDPTFEQIDQLTSISRLQEHSMRSPWSNLREHEVSQ
jgi:hypothetical protein